ncbi:beta-1,6-N-acetylglucosaminyltransferase [Sediminibacterium sp.]|uniref:beta-1,6-N-acetylglucosaminyltransferase n=1 Tax=Sediminibacterium sp. TaxID=1917865 RepID=UPI00273630FC|nr:beta-1,6-N-acetylglucosaminyltransferase [Sediminibacterium sp.]MDP3394735.1 beta-1,6-N-acetylglucosaminyltransferase [Sediminibacterium sp.]MDP3568570.1 beta-1,6-N-acetylglucosaminyltransferase [Sediminibacterium sp.]
MRIAHLIFVHKSPLQFERLLMKLISINADIYVHVDKKVDINQFVFLSNNPNIFYIQNRVSINWGNYTMVKAILSSFEEIINSKIEYSHINLLSGQDYPLKKIEDFESFLSENKGKSFIQSLSIYNEWHNSKERLTKYCLGDWNIPAKHSIQKLTNWIFPKRKFPTDLEPYGSSSWFVITPDCIKYVLDYLKMNPKITHFFKYTWGVDEIIFQTILLNSHLKETIINDNLRYIVFENKSPHPKILNLNDAVKLIDSDKFFARKFCMDADSKILDYLDTLLR